MERCKLSTSAQAALRVLNEASVPMSPKEIGAQLGFTQTFANVLLRRELRDTYVTRKKVARQKGGKGGLQYLYWPIGREWPDIPEWDGVTAHARRRDAQRARKRERLERQRLKRLKQEATRSADRRARVLRAAAHEGGAEYLRRARKQDRFPDHRFPVGTYNKAPLTAAEEMRLWSWANR